MTEPWCWHPDQIARLTDDEIERIRGSQAEKVRLTERKMDGPTTGGFDGSQPAGPRLPPTPQSMGREAFISTMGQLGYTPAEAAAAYEQSVARGG